jgi:hypothetical protein
MQIDKFKDYSGLLLRWTLIVVSISFAWSIIPISSKIDFLVEANQAMMLDIAVIKEKVMQLENKVDKP